MLPPFALRRLVLFGERKPRERASEGASAEYRRRTNGGLMAACAVARSRAAGPAPTQTTKDGRTRGRWKRSEGHGQRARADGRTGVAMHASGGSPGTDGIVIPGPDYRIAATLVGGTAGNVQLPAFFVRFMGTTFIFRTSSPAAAGNEEFDLGQAHIQIQYRPLVPRCRVCDFLRPFVSSGRTEQCFFPPSLSLRVCLCCRESAETGTPCASLR